MREREPNPQERKIFFHFVRHGEPEEYGETDSPLSPIGRRQIEGYARNFLNSLEGKPEVRIAYSRRRRTRESADIIEAAFKSSPGVYFGMWPQNSIEPHDTLEPLIEAGIDSREAFSEWRKNAEFVYKEVVDIRGPKDIWDDIHRVVRRFLNISSVIPKNKPDWHLILVTHETTIASLAAEIGVDLDNLQIGYAESLKIEISDERMKYSFRDLLVEKPIEKRG
ncbi:MAG: histidine phosphatase family protein [Candidatus Curtissbacteria bacterium]|nr:histidine phosphatase family protein [Candidatus Curtissbacteria bacterium]